MRLTKITYPEQDEKQVKEKKSKEEEEQERKAKEKEEWKRTLLLQNDGQSAPGERYIVNAEEEEEAIWDENNMLYNAKQLYRVLDNKFDFIEKKVPPYKKDDSSSLKVFRQSDKSQQGDYCTFVPVKRPAKLELSKEEKRKRMKESMVESSQILASADSYSYIPRNTSHKANDFSKKQKDDKT